MGLGGQVEPSGTASALSGTQIQRSHPRSLRVHHCHISVRAAWTRGTVTDSRQGDQVTLRFTLQSHDQSTKPVPFLGYKRVCVQTQTATHPNPDPVLCSGVWLPTVGGEHPLLTVSLTVPSHSCILSLGPSVGQGAEHGWAGVLAAPHSLGEHTWHRAMTLPGPRNSPHPEPV